MIGKVEKLNVWNTGKGYFFEVGGETYVGSGKPTVVVGDEITFEKEKPFGNDGKKFFANKIRKLGEASQPIESYVDVHIAKPIYQNNDRSKTIQRLAIMKMAIRLVCSKIENGASDLSNPDDLALEIKKQADALEKVI
jgi:hypothetical protein